MFHMFDFAVVDQQEAFKEWQKSWKKANEETRRRFSGSYEKLAEGLIFSATRPKPIRDQLAEMLSPRNSPAP
jgi:hypothetical protein